jgi:hypothetical protein
MKYCAVVCLFVPVLVFLVRTNYGTVPNSPDDNPSKTKTKTTTGGPFTIP